MIPAKPCSQGSHLKLNGAKKNMWHMCHILRFTCQNQTYLKVHLPEPNITHLSPQGCLAWKHLLPTGRTSPGTAAAPVLGPGARVLEALAPLGARLFLKRKRKKKIRAKQTWLSIANNQQAWVDVLGWTLWWTSCAGGLSTIGKSSLLILIAKWACPGWKPSFGL